MGTRDLYEVLGLSRSASTEEIKRAYRKLAKQHHPDRNPSDRAEAEARFKEVQHAYSILGNAEKRAQYDRFGEVGVGDVRTNPTGQRVYTWGNSGSQVNVEDLEDLFNIFGGRGGAGGGPFDEFFQRVGVGRSRRPQPMAGNDVTRRINLAFEQAVRGATIEVDVNSGRQRGEGRETLEVAIPPGVEEGQKIRLKGKGEPGSGGGPPGDLYLVCSVRPHPVFHREGQDILVDVPVTIPEAALGGKVEVPTLDGPVELTVPPGTSSGAKLRLKGRGVPAHGRQPTGDQLACVRVVTPKSLTEEQRKLMEQLAATLKDNPQR
jgi:DnaJ-class molecular chaperone